MKNILTAVLILCCLCSEAQTEKHSNKIKITNQTNQKQKYKQSIWKGVLSYNHRKTRTLMYLLKDSIYEFDGVNFNYQGSNEFTYSGTRSSHLKFDFIEDLYNGGYTMDLAGVNSNFDQNQYGFPPNLGKLIRIYNTQNQVTTEIDLDYNSTTMLYDTNFVTNFYYNTSNQLINDTADQFFCQQFQYTGSNLTEILTKNWSGTTWDNLLKEMYTYNSNNKIISYNQAEWNGSSWDVLDPLYITYNINQTVDSIYYLDINNIPEAVLKYTYSGSNILPTQLDIYELNTTTSILEYLGKIDYTYNSDSFLTKKQYKQYVSPGVFNDDSYTTFHYQLSTSAPSVLQNTLDINVFPNPSFSNTFLSYSTTLPLESKIKVIDILGNTVFEKKEPCFIGDHLVRIPLVNLPNGLYLIKLQVGEIEYLAKVIRQ